MTQWFGSSAMAGTGLIQRLNFSTALLAYGLAQRYDFKAENLTHGDVSGTERVSRITPVAGSGDLVQVTGARQPTYYANGGPGGYSDGVEFLRSEGNRLDGPVGFTGTQHWSGIMKVSSLGATGVNGIVYGTPISGNGRAVVYVRENTLNSPLLSGYIGQSGVDAGVSLAIPLGVDLEWHMSWNAATRALRMGYRASGDSAITWSAENIGEVGTAITQTTRYLGSNAAFGDAASVRMSALDLFDGYAGYDEPGLIEALAAKNFGPNSIFNL